MTGIPLAFTQIHPARWIKSIYSFLLFWNLSCSLAQVYFSSSESVHLSLILLVVYWEMEGPEKSAVLVLSASGLPVGRMSVHSQSQYWPEFPALSPSTIGTDCVWPLTCLKLCLQTLVTVDLDFVRDWAGLQMPKMDCETWRRHKIVQAVELILYM